MYDERRSVEGVRVDQISIRVLFHSPDNRRSLKACQAKHKVSFATTRNLGLSLYAQRIYTPGVRGGGKGHEKLSAILRGL